VLDVIVKLASAAVVASGVVVAGVVVVEFVVVEVVAAGFVVVVGCARGVLFGRQKKDFVGY